MITKYSNKEQFEKAKYVINTVLHWLKCCTPFSISLEIISFKFFNHIDLNSIALNAKHFQQEFIVLFKNSDSETIIDTLSNF